MNTADRIIGILAEKVGIETTEINPDTTLAEDLGLDSLDMVEVSMTLEEKFNVDVDMEELTNMSTVENLTNYIEQK